MSIVIQMDQLPSSTAQDEQEDVAPVTDSAVASFGSPQSIPETPYPRNSQEQGEGGNIENWNIVSAHRDGYGILRKISVRHGEDSITIFTKIREETGTIARANAVLYDAMCFSETGIFEAAITQRTSTGFEELYAFVDVDSLRFNPLLTAAFHDRIILNGRDFVRQHIRFAQPNRAMVIGRRANKSYIVKFILMMCILTIGIGILVGMVCHNAPLGINVSNAAAAELAILAVVLIHLAT